MWSGVEEQVLRWCRGWRFRGLFGRCGGLGGAGRIVGEGGTAMLGRGGKLRSGVGQQRGVH